jgi:hypothetical protein
MSHNVIAILVRAPDGKSAKEDAKAVFDKVKTHSSSYDAFEVDDAFPYDSEKGKSALQRIFGYQTLEFNDHLSELRNIVTANPNMGNDELMENHQFRFLCWEVGDTNGWNMNVFDSDAEGVQDKAHLKNLVDDWPGLVSVGQHIKSIYPLWVVSGNAHY